MKRIDMEETALAAMENRPAKQTKMVFLQMSLDHRRYNEPAGDGVAAIFVGEEGAPPTTLDFAVHPESGQSTTTSNLSPHMDPMVYPLLFPSGEQGWEIGLKHKAENATSIRQKLTMLQYYAFRMAIRPGFSAIHGSGKKTRIK